MSGLFAVCGSISADMIGYAPRLPGPGESVLGDRFLLAPGGKGANVAVAAARLGADVRFFGARGDDQFGEFIGTALAGEGVDVSSLRVIAGMHSGVALIAVDAQAENQILALPGANGQVGPPSPCGAAVWFCPGEIPRAAHEGTLAAARADGAIAVVNPSPPNAIDADLVARFDLAIVNETELDAFAGHLPARVVLTRGAQGRRAAARGHRAARGARQGGRHDGSGRCLRGRPVRRPGERRAARGSGAARARDGRDLRRAGWLPAVLRAGAARWRSAPRPRGSPCRCPERATTKGPAARTRHRPLPRRRQPIGATLTASGPLVPSRASYSTREPSVSVRKPEETMFV